MTSEPRIIRLKQWMADNNITWRAIGERLGITAQGASLLLNKETMPTVRHAQLLALGFPLDALPQPLDLRPGPMAKRPNFPGLLN